MLPFCMMKSKSMHAKRELFSLVKKYLKRPVSYVMSDHYKDKGSDNKGKIYFPAKFNPGTVVNPTHGKLDERAARPKAVGNTVTILVSQNQNLLVDVQNFSQWLKNRHDDNCLSAAGNDQKVKCCYKNKDD